MYLLFSLAIGWIMKKCAMCGMNNNDSRKVCLRCGETLVAADNEILPSGKGTGPRPAKKTDSSELKPYFQNIFSCFKEGSSPAKWNWYAAFFQLLWYAVKGLWPKIFLYATVYWALVKLFLFFGLYSFFPVIWILSFIYFGYFANYDYFLLKEKNEHFWPVLNYAKFKTPFWLLIISLILYNGVYQTYRDAKKIISYTRKTGAGPVPEIRIGEMEFSDIPEEWFLYEDPPPGFEMKLSRPVGNKGITETMSLTAYPGTRFIGYNVTRNVYNRPVYMGLISITEVQGRLLQDFGDIRAEDVIDRAKLYSGAKGLPFFMKWLDRWFTVSPADIEYVQLSGNEWGHIRNILDLDLAGHKIVFYLDLYWTVRNERAVYVCAYSFASYKDKIRSQLKRFLMSMETPSK
jgi:hypothetical protein